MLHLATENSDLDRTREDTESPGKLPRSPGMSRDQGVQAKENSRYPVKREFQINDPYLFV